MNQDEKYRKDNGIITISEIEEILTKYQIGKKPLSKLLGWGEVTVIRYLDGQMPERMYSDILIKILDNPFEMEKYLERNKKLITTVAYNKSVDQIKYLKSREDLNKTILIAKHIIAKVEDISAANVCKLLYFIQGFSAALDTKIIFDDKCIGYSCGPIYRNVLSRFSYYVYDPLYKNEFSSYVKIDLPESEIQLIDSVIKYLGCYNGKILERISKKTLPWLKTRESAIFNENATKTIYMLDIENYFTSLVNKYSINRPNDIGIYAIESYKNILKEDTK